MSLEPLSNVAVFNVSKTVSVVSNEQGVVNLEAFKNTDTLIFQHPAYSYIFFTKQQLKQMNFKMQLEKNVQMLGEVVLSASKFEEKRRDVPMRMEVIDIRDAVVFNPQTSADYLQSTGNIMVQKSQLGGGSPVIRGFEANKVLLVVDGVRMNNAIYRSGHLQNSITIDNEILERTEIIFGPGAVIYGSDALGGVMHFYTKTPELAQSDSSVNSKFNGLVRYSSANREQTAHFNFQAGFKKLALVTGITHNDFHDLRVGTERNSEYPGFGVLNYYHGVTSGGGDTLLINEDSNVMRNTGYTQVNLLQKLLYQPNPKLGFILNIQYSSSSIINRFDKLNDMVGDTLKYAEWYYGPQNRLFTSLSANINDPNKFLDKGSIVVGYQKLMENRTTRKFLDTNRIVRDEAVRVYSLNIDFYKKVDSSKNFQYGIEATYNDVASNAYSQNIFDSSTAFATTRYPDGGSNVQAYAAYFAYKWVLNPKSILNAGIRYNQSILLSKFADTSTYKLPFNSISNNTSAFNGSIGLVVRPTPKWQLNLLASSGFRSPNVDDMGKVFAKDEFVTVPNDQLLPENLYSGEIGILRLLGDRGSSIQASAYYSYLTNAIVKREFKLNGQDSIKYDGEMLKVVANTNTGEAIIYGGFLKADLQLSAHLRFISTLSYTYGEDLVERVPLSHISPAFGKTTLSYNFGRWEALKPIDLTIYSYYHGWKHRSDYSPSNVDNLEEATIDGTPAWYTLNVMSSYTWKIKSHHDLEELIMRGLPKDRTIVFQFGVENILDRHYKPFASGISGPGRNFILSLRAYL